MPQKFLLWTVVLLGFYNHAFGQDGPYIQMGLGIAVANRRRTDNDWSTFNPDGLEVTDECDSVPAPTEWKNAFGGGSGIGSGLALGYRWGPFRIEGEYFHRSTTYVDIINFDEITIDKEDQEIELTVGGLDNLQSHNLFANAYYDFAGAGASVARWSRQAHRFTISLIANDDPSRIRTFADPDLNASRFHHDRPSAADRPPHRLSTAIRSAAHLKLRLASGRKRKNRVGSTAQPRLHSGARRADSIHYHHG